MTRFPRIFNACIAVAAVTLAACSTPPYGPQDAYDANARFPISVQPRMMTLRILYNGQSALDQNATGQLARFAEDYLQHGSGTIAVTAARGYPDAPMLVADGLIALGVGRNQIMVGNSDAPDLNDDVKVTYIRYVATSPLCGDWSTNLTQTSSNRVPANFGCATQRNIATMVADPRDLLAPENGGQPDARRRLTVLDKYRKGEPTPATRTQAQSGTVSQVSSGGM